VSIDADGHAVRILFVGDVVGGIGRRTLSALLPALKERHAVDFTVVNGENAAGGLGITPKVAEQIFAAGADVITSCATAPTTSSSTCTPRPRARRSAWAGTSTGG
jgi:hypothetical protein